MATARMPQAVGLSPNPMHLFPACLNVFHRIRLLVLHVVRWHEIRPLSRVDGSWLETVGDFVLQARPYQIMLPSLHNQVLDLLFRTEATAIDHRTRLKASEFKANKDQRKPINRLNRFVLGPEYKRKAAMLCPQTRERVTRMLKTGASLTWTERNVVCGINSTCLLQYTKRNMILSKNQWGKRVGNRSNQRTNLKSTSKETTSPRRSL